MLRARARASHDEEMSMPLYTLIHAIRRDAPRATIVEIRTDVDADARYARRC